MSRTQLLTYTRNTLKKKVRTTTKCYNTQGLFDLTPVQGSWHESISKRDYTAECHNLFSLKQCGINMIIQSEAPIDSVRLGDVSCKNNVFDIFIKLCVVSQRNNKELLRVQQVLFEGLALDNC